MSDEGEKTCPLCAEEMDLTDQQLKPCKCGYEICVWCWHHIMDMAEKDDTEGRCPACRTPYNKEKIVGTASKCERLVADMSVDKKQKSQKGKTKTSEGRKQLSSVRVIQRNLVYIVGLPLNLADEDLLQRKDYFGQYGKVLKVSISRTAAGLIQQSANNTCSVYITYSKEEEAVRSIQSVHGFVLEGRPLRACFGTTKYCHAWLRSVPCTNPDCLYLHEFGPQDDSFTKDEIITAYTRVQQITGATNDVQRRSGNLLPPPADDYCNNDTSSWGKPISKNTTNIPANGVRGSPPNSSSGRSVALPAAASWGTRASTCQPLAVNVATSNGPSKQKADTCSTTLSFSTAVVSPSHNEIVKKHVESQTFEEEGEPEHQESVKQRSQLCTASTKEKNKSIHLASASSNHVQEKDMNVADERMIHNISSDMLLMSIDRKNRLKPSDNEQFTEPLASHNKATNDISVSREESDSVASSRNKVAEVAINEIEEDLLSFNNQRLTDPEISTHTSYVQNLTQSSPHSNYTMGYSPQQAYATGNGSLDTPFVNQKLEKASIPQTSRIPVVNGYLSGSSNGHSYFLGAEGDRKRMGIYEEAAKGDCSNALDLGENRIISNILSMEFDPWNDSLTSPQNLAKLLGENEKLQGSLRASSSRKAQSSNQSRFSFAREDKPTPTSSDFGPGFDNQNFNSDFVSNRDIYRDKLSAFSFQESDNFSTTHPPMYPNKISGSRSHISAPPGFSGPSRAPPPGFTSHERMEETFDNLSGNHMFDNFSLLRKTHQASPPVNSGSIGDVVFMDPAILAVGGRVPGGHNSAGLDMRSNYPTQMNSFENDNNRLQLLMQRSFSPQQNHRYTEINDSFPHRSDAYGIPYQQASFQQQPRSSSSMMSNGHWDGWNEVHSGNDVAMAELLRNERLGLNKYNNYSGYEDTKFRLSNSGDLYNRTFGI